MHCTELQAEKFLNRLNHFVRRPLAQCNMCLFTNMPQYTHSSNTMFVEHNVREQKCFSFLCSKDGRKQGFCSGKFCNQTQESFQVGLKLLVSVLEDFGFESFGGPILSELSNSRILDLVWEGDVEKRQWELRWQGCGENEEQLSFLCSYTKEKAFILRS